jgi:acyl-CoA thioester hydrolase
MGAPMITTQKLRFCDTDQLGHVNNAVYSVLLEAGRVEMVHAAGLLDPRAGFAVVIARLELDYLREMNWPGEVRIETAVHRLGNKSFHVRQRLVLGGEITAKAHTVLAVMDMNTRKALPLREDWRAALEQWLVPEF